MFCHFQRSRAAEPGTGSRRSPQCRPRKAAKEAAVTRSPQGAMAWRAGWVRMGSWGRCALAPTHPTPALETVSRPAGLRSRARWPARPSEPQELFQGRSTVSPLDGDWSSRAAAAPGAKATDRVPP